MRSPGEWDQADLESSGVFLTFDNADLEQRWWHWWKRRALRKVELLGAWATLIITAIAFIVLVFSDRSLSEWPWLFALGVWFLESVAQVSLLMCPEHLYHRLHDPLGFLLRGLLNPLISVSLRATMHNRLAPSWEDPISLGFHFILVFGVVDIIVDAARYPLRFKDHLMVQGVLSVIWWLMDSRICKNWLRTSVQEKLVGRLCSSIGALTTGVYFDCSTAEMQNACITGSLQVQVLFGAIMTSALMYTMERRARREFLVLEKDKSQ